MELIRPRLFLGKSSDAMVISNLIENKITAVLNVASDLNYLIDHKYEDGKKIVQYHIGMTDGLNNPKELFPAAVLTLKGLLNHGHTVLVHCHQGRSRSPSVIAAYLAVIENSCFADKLLEVAKIRAAVNPEPGMIQYAEKCMKYIHDTMELI